MAIVAPGVEYRQLTGKSHTPLTHDIICAHTMVGTLEGSIAYAARAGNPYWHFGIGGNGHTVQCQDLTYRSAANLNGNWHVIPIETADINEGVFPTPWANPPWTEPQIRSLIDLIAWLCVRFNIPPVVISDTRPGQRGLAYHRQGVNPWRLSGGELWSNANGKICPAARIDQFLNLVVPAVQAKVWKITPPLPKPPSMEDEMPFPTFHVDGDPAQFRRAITSMGPLDVPNDEYYSVLVQLGVIKESKPVNQRQYDIATDFAARFNDSTVGDILEPPAEPAPLVGGDNPDQ